MHSSHIDNNEVVYLVFSLVLILIVPSISLDHKVTVGVVIE